MTRLEELEQELKNTIDIHHKLTGQGVYKGKVRKRDRRYHHPHYDVAESNRLIRKIDKLHTKINQEKQKHK